MVVAAFIGIAFAAAALLTLACKVRFAETRAFWMFVVGGALAAAFLVFVYLQSPTSYASSNGTDGQMFLGRWWDPAWTVMMFVIPGLVGWGLGVAAGLILRGALDESRPGS